MGSAGCPVATLVTPFQLDMYRTASAAGWLPWLLLTTVVVAPIGEDTFFAVFCFAAGTAPIAMLGP